MDANGIVILVPVQLEVGISPSSNGRERMDMSVLDELVPQQLEVGERMDVNGTVILVIVQLKVGISPSSDGREKMDVIGITSPLTLQL
jgi:hypothetical protein